MNPVKSHWQEILLAQLPSEQYIRNRNMAISGTYAKWFFDHPDWFRWAGMASFASHRVGQLLALYDYSYDYGRISGVDDTYGSFEKQHVLVSLEVLRTANNEAFANSGWAHFAYLANEGGIRAVEEGLSDDPTQFRLLDGFRLIERARRLLESSPSEREQADELFWSGNLLLFQHEQWGVIQQHFAQLSDTELGLLLTFITSLDFDATFWATDQWNCEFFKYMWTRGVFKLIATFSLPDVTKLAHRWAWARNQVFTTWQKVVRQDPHLRLKVASIIRAGQAQYPEGKVNIKTV
jgi:hypothetical protein